MTNYWYFYGFTSLTWHVWSVRDACQPWITATGYPSYPKKNLDLHPFKKKELLLISYWCMGSVHVLGFLFGIGASSPCLVRDGVFCEAPSPSTSKGSRGSCRMFHSSKKATIWWQPCSPWICYWGYTPFSYIYYIYMYVWLCMYDYVCMIMYVWLCMYDYVCMIMYVWLCMYVCIYTSCW